ncbi:MAG: radical SAM protein [Calditrichaeota bacterium]|nr:MAG: radical SAM protein [Calditrichota bacterium]
MRGSIKHLTNLLRSERRRSETISLEPLKAEWALTGVCNAGCLTCIHWQNREDEKPLTFAEGRGLITQLADLGLRELTFTGGEPLLRKDLSELVAFAKSKSLTVSLETNGLLLTERCARELVDAGLDAVYVSIDAADAEVNDRLRGLNGYFDLAMAAMDNLKAMRRNADPKIFIRTTVTVENQNQLVPLAQLAKTKGIEGFGFQLAQLVESAGFVFDRSLLVQNNDPTVLLKQLNELLNQHAGFLTGSLEYYRTLRNYVQNPEYFKEPRLFSGFSYVYIDACGGVFDSPLKGRKLGSLREQSFQEIWFGEKAAESRRNPDANFIHSYLFESVANSGRKGQGRKRNPFVKLVEPIISGSKV